MSDLFERVKGIAAAQASSVLAGQAQGPDEIDYITRAVGDGEMYSADAAAKIRAFVRDAVSAKDARIAELRHMRKSADDHDCAEIEDEVQRLRGRIEDLQEAAERERDEYKAANEKLRAEVGRLHTLLQRANALLPPDDPVNQEIEREYETCTQTIEKLRDWIHRAQHNGLCSICREPRPDGGGDHVHECE